MTALAVETRRGFSQAEVDEMELWVIALYLGIGEEQPAAAGAGTITEPQFREQAAALNAERVRRRQAGLPEPEAPRSATPEVSPDMIRALRERREQREAAKQGA